MNMEPVQAIRFRCQPGCTNCCEQKGYVYVSEDDIERAAAFVGMKRAEFERKYVCGTKRRRRFKKPRHSECPFLVEGGCSIHPAKPTQCRAFPFWPELVESRPKWSATRLSCPGIGQGPLIQIKAIEESLREMREAYPALYE